MNLETRENVDLETLGRVKMVQMIVGGEDTEPLVVNIDNSPNCR